VEAPVQSGEFDPLQATATTPDAQVDLDRRLVLYAPRVALEVASGEAMPGFTKQIVSRALISDLAAMSTLNISQATAMFDRTEHCGRFCLVHYKLEEWNIEIDIVIPIGPLPEPVLDIIESYREAMASKVRIMTREKQDFRQVDKKLGLALRDWDGLLNAERPVISLAEYNFVRPFIVAARNMVAFPVHLDKGAKLIEPRTRLTAQGSPFGLRPGEDSASYTSDPIRHLHVGLPNETGLDAEGEETAAASPGPVSYKVGLSCPACHVPTQPGDRYCRKCGASLVEGKPEPM
jgi:hypothetical protein